MQIINKTGRFNYYKYIFICLLNIILCFIKSSIIINNKLIKNINIYLEIKKYEFYF